MLQKKTTSLKFREKEVTIKFNMQCMEYVFDLYPQIISGGKNNPLTMIGGMVHCALMAAGYEDATKADAFDAIEEAANTKQIIDIAVSSMADIAKLMGGEVATTKKEPVEKRLKKA